MFRNDQTYTGTVTGGTFFQSAAKGTPGYQVNIESEHGDISYVIWLTQKNRDRITRDFETLGIDASRMGSRAFIEHELPGLIAGRPIAFHTRSEEYNNKTSMKVAWIGKPKAASETELLADVASFFAEQKAPTETTQEQDGGSFDDDEIPFSFFIGLLGLPAMWLGFQG